MVRVNNVNFTDQNFLSSFEATAAHKGLSGTVVLFCFNYFKSIDKNGCSVKYSLPADTEMKINPTLCSNVKISNICSV